MQGLVGKLGVRHHVTSVAILRKNHVVRCDFQWGFSGTKAWNGALNIKTFQRSLYIPENH